MRGAILTALLIVLIGTAAGTARTEREVAAKEPEGIGEIVIIKVPEATPEPEYPDFDLMNLSCVMSAEEAQEGKKDAEHRGSERGGGTDQCGAGWVDYDAGPGEGAYVIGNVGGDNECNQGENNRVAGDSGSAESNGGAAITPEENELTHLGTWTATAYCSCPVCCGEYASGYTASGTLATAGRTVACNVLPFGTQLMIDGTVYTVEDTGYSPYGDAWVDIYFDSHEEALAFGVREVEVYQINGNL